MVIDASDQVNVFLMAGLLADPDPASAGFDLARLREEVAARLPLPELARFRQRIHLEPPLHWEDADPDLDWHIRQVAAAPQPVTLAGLCARLMTVQLPQDRPLWEVLVLPGAASGRTGVVLRVHHAVADGVGVVAMVQRLFGSAPPALRPPSAGPAAPATPRWQRVVGGIARVLAVFRSSVGPTPLLGPIGDRREVAFAEVDLEPLARAARRVGATVNDALLAAVSGALAAVLPSRGAAVPPTLPVSVPVALPERGGSGNAVGVMRIMLPVGEPDPGARLVGIAGQSRRAKAQARSQGTFELTRTRWSARLFARLARRQRFVALFVTNVRGPGQPLSIGGTPLERAWPVTPIQGNVRLGVSAMSYAGRFGVAVHVDAAALPADLLGRALTAELGRLAEG